MDTKAKAATSSSCLSFLKDALLLPTRNARLFFPVLLLVTIHNFLLQITDVFCIQPLTTGILLRIDEIMKSMDPSTSPGYAKLATEILNEARELIIAIAVMMTIALVCGSTNQIVALFAASSTYSGDRYSLSELFSRVVVMKGRRLRGPLITIAMVSILDIACMPLLLAALQLLQLDALYDMAFLSVFLLIIAFLYLNVVFAVAVAVSVADTERRGVGALRQAWRLMTRVRRKEGYVLLVVVLLLAIVPSPLEAAAVGYSSKSMPMMGLSLLFVDALLSGLLELFYFTAVMVYYHQAMESKEVMPHDDYVKIPTGEATV